VKKLSQLVSILRIEKALLSKVNKTKSSNVLCLACGVKEKLFSDRWSLPSLLDAPRTLILRWEKENNQSNLTTLVQA